MLDVVELAEIPVVEEWTMAGSRMPWEEPRIQEQGDDATKT